MSRLPPSPQTEGLGPGFAFSATPLRASLVRPSHSPFLSRLDHGHRRCVVSSSMMRSSSSIDSTRIDTTTCKYNEKKEVKHGSSGSSGNGGNCSNGGVRSCSGGRGSSSPGSRGHLGHDLDRLVSSVYLSSPPHHSGRVGLGEYNVAGRCGVSSPLRSLSSLDDASFNTRRPGSGDGECKQAIYTEERKAQCQKKKTQQREENCIDFPVRFSENTIKDQDEETQTGSTSSIDGDVVDKRGRPRIEGKNKTVRLQKRSKHSKITLGH